MNKILFCTFLVFYNFILFSQDLIENKVYRENIETVLLYKEGSETTYPIINLTGTEKLTLSFDEIAEDENYKDFQYTIIHCDANWKQSDLMFSEYIDGYEENDMVEISNSFSTFCKYVNYQITFPNDYINFQISGNYIIKVYEDYDTENVVLTKRFCVTEQLIKIEATAKKPTNPSLMDSYHEVDFSIDYSGYTINNPIKDLKVVISQNNRSDNLINGLTPKFIKDKNLDYNYDFENTFPAGNEFRYFDSKNIKFSSERIGKIEFTDNFYHQYLKEDKIRSTEPYLFNKDLNGLRVIRSEQGLNSSTDADYSFIHFTFKRDFPFIDDLYIIGEFTDWQCDEKYKMSYNYELQQYEAVLFLKQGYYNYFYTLKSSIKNNTAVTEGNFYQTENDYLIYVYHYDTSFRYDRLIGVKIFNSGQ
jgi:hypothetical protein